MHAAFRARMPCNVAVPWGASAWLGLRGKQLTLAGELLCAGYA
jgi:hypothetical protein